MAMVNGLTFMIYLEIIHKAKAIPPGSKKIETKEGIL
jgi:hypothetical protein